MSARNIHHNDACRPSGPAAKAMGGFTLVELMVAMLLGLVVIAGVGSVFLSNQQVYRTNKALSDVQDSERIAFEMMARDIRTSGLSGCDNSGRVANVLNNGPYKSGGTLKWWANWGTPLIGYTASQTDPAAQDAGVTRVGATESLVLLGIEGSGASVKTDTEPAGTITVNETTTDLKTGDIVMVCDPDHAAIAQLTTVAGSTLTHAASGTPGNCTTDLSYPTVCSSGSSYVYSANAEIAKLTAADWYVGQSASGDGTNSLYRIALTNNAGALSAQASEMVKDVTSLTFAYLQSGATTFVAANAVTDWSQVNAVQVTMTMQSVDARAGTNVQPITRTFTSTTTLRNRVE